MTIKIRDYALTSGTGTQCVEEIRETLRTSARDCRWMACLNPHSYAVARSEPEFAEALKAADWLVPDGVGIVIAGSILGTPFSERITGYDIFEGVMRELNVLGGSVFFLGGTNEALSLIERKVSEEFPSVRFAGSYSPPFKDFFSDADVKAMVSAVASANADVLWVGMTAPKQERWIAQNRGRLPVKFAGAIGAVFDFYTGRVKRSHPFFRRIGLEWLPRLIQQPRRLWRRMFISAPIFLLDIASDRIRKIFNSGSG